MASFRRGDRLNLPFMAHRFRPFAVIALLFAAACTDPLTSADLLGEWGGEHIGLTVLAAGATLEYDCASGTIDAAYASYSENELGSISPGKLADLVVLSQDVFTIDPAEIHKVETLLTIFDGRVVYRSESSFE